MPRYFFGLAGLFCTNFQSSRFRGGAARNAFMMFAGVSGIGHGQVPFMGDQATAAAVSFARVTQRVTASFAQLRRVSLGPGQQAADAAARALLVALGLHAHVLAWNEELARTGQSRRAPQGRGLWRPWVQGRSGLRGYLKASTSQQSPQQGESRRGSPESSVSQWAQPSATGTPRGEWLKYELVKPRQTSDRGW